MDHYRSQVTGNAADEDRSLAIYIKVSKLGQPPKARPTRRQATRTLAIKITGAV